MLLIVGLTIDSDLLTSCGRVYRSLNSTIEWRGKPKPLKCDSEPEYISHKLVKCAVSNSVELRLFNQVNRKNCLFKSGLIIRFRKND